MITNAMVERVSKLRDLAEIGFMACADLDLGDPRRDALRRLLEIVSDELRESEEELTAARKGQTKGGAA